MNIHDEIAKLPEWSSAKSCNMKIAVGYCQDCDEQDKYAARARLALLRKWAAEANHHDGCECLYYVASSEMWFASDDKPCTCGRDALLAATEPPK